MKRKLLWIVLWVLFSIGSIVAAFLTPFLTLCYPFINKHSQIAKMVESADRMIAAFYFGCSGRWTLSIECAHRQPKLFVVLRCILDRVKPGHCEESAFNEGAYCEYPRED